MRPEKRPALDRQGDFAEIYQPWSHQALAEQAERCSQCGIPFCQSGCPLSNNIPDWLRLAAEGREEEAYRLSAATNPMPEICGRICPQDRLCEGSCVIDKGFGSVTIGAVEKYLTDKAFENGWVDNIQAGKSQGKSVGIIGAGPAGLAAAEQLCRYGYFVHIYDRHDRAGGMLVYGIPEFKLEKQIVARRISRLEKAGIKFHLNFSVGQDASLDQLRAKHDVILIATGTYKARALNIDGSHLDGIVPALDYLTISNKVVLGDKVDAYDDGTFNAKDRDVVVIGGGDTAMDCVRTAIRQGAASVHCLYRRDMDNMPGSRAEVQNALEEGVHFMWLSAPVGFEGDNKVTGTQAIKMELGPADQDGRRRPQEVDGSLFTIKSDLVITALGFEAEDIPGQFDAPDLATTAWGTIECGTSDFGDRATNIEGVFAAGDISRGPSLVVEALKEGRDAARQMHRYLTHTDDASLDPVDEPGADYFSPIKAGVGR